MEGEVAEEIIRETCKELDIGVINKLFFGKESFTKEKYRFRCLRNGAEKKKSHTRPGT